MLILILCLSLTWWQVQLEEEFQLICERSTVQNICRKSNFKANPSSEDTFSLD